MELLSKEEEKLAKNYHIEPQGKFGYHSSKGFLTAFYNCEPLHDKVYEDLKSSDFRDFLKECDKGPAAKNQMINLFLAIDKYALIEDIIQIGHAQFLPVKNLKSIQRSNKTPIEKKVFTYEQIEYLWDFIPKREKCRQEKEEFIRDFLLIALYTGAKAGELLFIYTKDIFLDKNYFIGGLTTFASIDREIPIHPDIKHLFEKYYNPKNEFLFMQPNGNRIDYDYYLYHYKNNFRSLHRFVSAHTAQHARYTLRRELKKLNVCDVIANAIIGKSNRNVGEDIYSHVSIEEKLEAIKMVTYKNQ